MKSTPQNWLKNWCEFRQFFCVYPAWSSWTMRFITNLTSLRKKKRKSSEGYKIYDLSKYFIFYNMLILKILLTEAKFYNNYHIPENKRILIYKKTSPLVEPGQDARYKVARRAKNCLDYWISTSYMPAILNFYPPKNHNNTTWLYLARFAGLKSSHINKRKNYLGKPRASGWSEG